MPWAIRCRLMLTPGQDHDLTGAEPLLETANPRALIGDKAYDADPLIHSLDRRAITSSDPAKGQPQGERATVISCFIASAISSSASSTKSSITAASPRATTSSLEIFSPLSSWWRLSSYSTEDRS